jgi:hypothetical protein
MDKRLGWGIKNLACESEPSIDANWHVINYRTLTPIIAN